jgi:hypothetical protein
MNSARHIDFANRTFRAAPALAFSLLLGLALLP